MEHRRESYDGLQLLRNKKREGMAQNYISRMISGRRGKRVDWFFEKEFAALLMKF